MKLNRGNACFDCKRLGIGTQNASLRPHLASFERQNLISSSKSHLSRLSMHVRMCCKLAVHVKAVCSIKLLLRYIAIFYVLNSVMNFAPSAAFSSVICYKSGSLLQFIDESPQVFLAGNLHFGQELKHEDASPGETCLAGAIESGYGCF